MVILTTTVAGEVSTVPSVVVPPVVVLPVELSTVPSVVVPPVVVLPVELSTVPSVVVPLPGVLLLSITISLLVLESNNVDSATNLDASPLVALFLGLNVLSS